MDVLLIYPMFGMVLLTFFVACIAIKVRLASVKSGAVNYRYFRLMSGQDVPDAVTKTTRNFNNQFEIPVLFYVVCTLYISFGVESMVALVCAWLFILLRVVHTVVHLTSNHILHRMFAFWGSFFCVLILWINLLIIKLNAA